MQRTTRITRISISYRSWIIKIYKAVNLQGLLLFFVERRFYMPHFQKRGNRIRASDKSLVFRFSAGSLLLLFLAAVLLLNLKTIAATDWKSVHFLQDGSVHLTVTPYMIISVIGALLICGAAALLYRRFQYDRVKQLFHRQSWQR